MKKTIRVRGILVSLLTALILLCASIVTYSIVSKFKTIEAISASDEQGTYANEHFKTGIKMSNATGVGQYVNPIIQFSIPQATQSDEIGDTSNKTNVTYTHFAVEVTLPTPLTNGPVMYFNVIDKDGIYYEYLGYGFGDVSKTLPYGSGLNSTKSTKTGLKGWNSFYEFGQAGKCVYFFPIADFYSYARIDQYTGIYQGAYNGAGAQLNGQDIISVGFRLGSVNNNGTWTASIINAEITFGNVYMVKMDTSNNVKNSKVICDMELMEHSKKFNIKASTSNTNATPVNTYILTSIAEEDAEGNYCRGWFNGAQYWTVNGETLTVGNTNYSSQAPTLTAVNDYVVDTDDGDVNGVSWRVKNLTQHSTSTNYRSITSTQIEATDIRKKALVLRVSDCDSSADTFQLNTDVITQNTAKGVGVETVTTKDAEGKDVATNTAFLQDYTVHYVNKDFTHYYTIEKASKWSLTIYKDFDGYIIFEMDQNQYYPTGNTANTKPANYYMTKIELMTNVDWNNQVFGRFYAQIGYAQLIDLPVDSQNNRVLLPSNASDASTQFYKDFLTNKGQPQFTFSSTNSQNVAGGGHVLEDITHNYTVKDWEWSTTDKSATVTIDGVTGISVPAENAEQKQIVKSPTYRKGGTAKFSTSLYFDGVKHTTDADNYEIYTIDKLNDDNYISAFYGASVGKDVNGGARIRWGFCVDYIGDAEKSGAYDKIKDNRNNLEFGILIAPYDKLGKNELTIDNYATYEGERKESDFDTHTTTRQEDKFYASITITNDKNLARYYVARAYLILEDGTIKYTEMTVPRSVYQVAAYAQSANDDVFVFSSYQPKMDSVIYVKDGEQQALFGYKSTYTATVNGNTLTFASAEIADKVKVIIFNNKIYNSFTPSGNTITIG